MNPVDKKRFAELIAGLAQTFQTPISAGDLENYWQLLKGFPLSAIEQSVVLYCRSPEGHQFFPKPGELVTLIQGGSHNHLALLAWSQVMRAIRAIGVYRSVVFEDPIIHAVIWDMGGWQELCLMRMRDAPFKCREFEKRYQGYQICPPTVYPKQLWGITDSANLTNGYGQMRPPTFVGDVQKALCVFKNGKEGHQLLPLKLFSAEQYQNLLAQGKVEEEVGS